jgi:hypothetical protein
MTTEINFNTVTKTIVPFGDVPWPDEPAKDVSVSVPPGLIGNPTTLAKCMVEELAFTSEADSPDQGPLCPSASQVGVTAVVTPFGTTVPLPMYNMATPPDVAARFGFNFAGVVTLLDAQVRTGSDYGVSLTAHNISEGTAIDGTQVTLWGVPADPSHDPDRSCPGQLIPQFGGPSCATDAPRTAFLRFPTSCPTNPNQGEKWTVSGDSWFHPNTTASLSFFTHQSPGLPDAPFPGLPQDQWGPQQGTTGCADVPFDPTFNAQPVDPASPGPSGYQFDLNMPQTDDPNQLGEADLRKAVIMLPQGVRVNPASADGLGGCSPAQVALKSTADPTCPDSSKIGTVQVTTPLLAKPLDGFVYLATPHDNPSNSLLALYVVAKGPGTIIKLPGAVSPSSSADGQLTATFDNNPQLPFSNFHLEFFGGDRAALSNPPRCGTYTTHATLTSWSGKTVTSDSSFTTSHDGHGAPCPAPQFSPSLNAGTVDPVAGVFTPFVLQLQRSDDDQEFGVLRSLSLPPGLLADVGSVPVRCTEVQARAAACPVASHIGEVNVGAGAGPDPFYVPGDVYLMGGFNNGPFKGDPFGLAVIVHAVAGPFDLGHVVVEAGIQVHDDGSITAQTEPFPSILEGIPLQLKDIRLNVDRPDFILNPTNCSQMAVAGSVASTEGMSAPVSSRFQVGECAALGFKPRFSASTQGNGTFNHNGASFDVKLTTNQGPRSHEANIRKVEVQLPKALPARLTTLQKACTEAQFASNPAGCPVASNVGTVIARSPILAAPLAGPAYLVSHGGAAFPDLVLVLQGEGIVLHVTGHTQIKNGITYSRFETVPDAPIASFELKLPEGPFSALAANANLCRTTTTRTVKKRVTVRIHGRSVKRTRSVRSTVTPPLAMPTTLTAQNGAVIQQNTKIAVTGCAKAKAVKHKPKRRKGAKRG